MRLPASSGAEHGERLLVLGVMLTDIPLIIAATETTGMEQDENNYYLSITHAAGLVTMFRSLPSTIYFSCCNANSLQKSSAIQ